jgi:hypothetical protein
MKKFEPTLDDIKDIDIPLFTSTKDQLSDPDLVIENQVHRLNILNDIENAQTSQFIVKKEHTQDIVKYISDLFSDNKFDNKAIIELYCNIVNPLYIKQQLLEFELNNIESYEIKQNSEPENVILNMLKRYKSYHIDDEEWLVEKTEKTVTFKNTYLDNYKYLVIDHIKKIIKIIEKIYPKHIDYDIDEQLDHCTRRVINVIFKL